MPILLADDLAMLRIRAREFLRGDDPESGHQLRVAARRLRALIWAYRQVLPEGVAKRVSRQLARMAAAVAPTRNWDLMSGMLSAAATRPPGARHLTMRDVVEAQRRTARDAGRQALRKAMRGVDAPLRDARVIAVPLTDVPTCGITLEKLAKRAVKRASRRLARACRRSGWRCASGMHRIRIRIKRLRYLLDYFRPLLGDEATAQARQLARLQDSLGRLNDLAIGIELLTSLPADPRLGDTPTQLRNWMRGEKQAQRRAAREHLRLAKPGMSLPVKISQTSRRRDRASICR